MDPELTMFFQLVEELKGNSGLSTESFIKKPTVQKITQEGLEKISKTCIPIAEYEGLFAHVDSIKTRLNK